MDKRIEADAAAVENGISAEGMEGFIRIGEMAKRFGVTLRALRFYEDKGLLSPRREGATRLYSRRDRARLKLILRGKRFGFSLEQIRQLLELYDPAERNITQTEAILATAHERLADMERQHAELGGAIVDLRQQIAEGEGQLRLLKSEA